MLNLLWSHMLEIRMRRMQLENIFVPEFRYIADRLFRATIQKPKRYEISTTLFKQ